jgi:ParB family transcriptional regulator, chromosome partitioning protein
MTRYRDNPEAAEQRRQRMAQVAAERGGPAQDPAPAGADPFRGRRAIREACEIAVGRIVPDPAQPRTEFDPGALARLAASVRARGVLQAIRVRWDAAGDRYVIVVGERRWRAAVEAGLAAVPCLVAPGGATADEILEDQLVENCLREDLRPVEQARAFKSLMGRLGVTQRDLAAKLNVSPAAVTQALRLLGLPEPIQAQVDAGAIAANTGYQIARVADPAEQAALAAAAAAGQLRRDDVAGRTRKPRGKGRGGRRPAAARSRTVRLAGGKVTLDLRRAGDAAAFLALAEDAAAALRRELAEQGGSAEAA